MKNLMAMLAALMMMITGGGAAPAPAQPLYELIREGDKTYIELIGNPSTGYVWTVFPIVEGVVTAKDPVALETESDVVGAPVKYRMEVEAAAAGETILVLRYLRPWEEAIQTEIPLLVTVDEEGEMFFMHLEGMPLEVTVAQVMEEEHKALVENENLGQVICTFPEEMALPMAGEHIKIWTNGVMALSLPGQMNVLGWETIAPPQARMMPADGE